jgi:RNA polymerase sigma factor (sigma-70 family)
MCQIVDAQVGLDPLIRWRTDMATRLNKVLEHLYQALAPPDRALTDGQLLARFVATREESAFAALVRRHGPMVFGICRRVLHHTQDAEDCFQATFLVLARKASSVRREAVGSWLYAVAYRTSLAAQTSNARRRARERQVEEMPHPEVMPTETQDYLDHELTLLPEHYRAVIIACDLEGLSRKEAARHLGLSEGTISSRLARGRRLLAKRLSLPGAVLATALTECTAPAHIPASLLSSTTKVALGQAALSNSVEILVKGALKAMLLTKLKVAVGAVMVMVALGASGLAYRASGQASPQLTQPKHDSKPRSELETLRRENELLKLNLEIVLEKVRAQEAELRVLKAQAGQTRAAAFSPDGRVLATVLGDRTGRLWDPATGKQLQNLGVFHDLKNDDKEALQRAVDALEKSLQVLRQQLKKPEAPPAGK